MPFGEFCLIWFGVGAACGITITVIRLRTNMFDERTGLLGSTSLTYGSLVRGFLACLVGGLLTVGIGVVALSIVAFDHLNRKPVRIGQKPKTKPLLHYVQFEKDELAKILQVEVGLAEKDAQSILARGKEK